MNKPTPLSDRPEVQRHLHRDNDVTRDRLDAFVTDDDATRLRVLAELRTRSVDQETTLTLTLQAAGISTVAVMLAAVRRDVVPAAPHAADGVVGYVAYLLACVVLGVFAVVIVLPSVWRAVKGNRDTARAAVWLAAYEDALAAARSPRRSLFRRR